MITVNNFLSKVNDIDWDKFPNNAGEETKQALIESIELYGLDKEIDKTIDQMLAIANKNLKEAPKAPKPEKKETYQDVLLNSPNVRVLTPRHQQMLFNKELIDVIKDLEKSLSEIPKLYSQDELGKKAIVHAHYFYAGSDWFITEIDKEEGLFFGFAILNSDTQNSEFGYIAITDLTQTKQVELDFYWDKAPLDEVLYKRYPNYYPEPEIKILDNPNVSKKTKEKAMKAVKKVKAKKETPFVNKLSYIGKDDADNKMYRNASGNIFKEINRVMHDTVDSICSPNKPIDNFKIVSDESCNDDKDENKKRPRKRPETQDEKKKLVDKFSKAGKEAKERSTKSNSRPKKTSGSTEKKKIIKNLKSEHKQPKPIEPTKEIDKILKKAIQSASVNPEKLTQADIIKLAKGIQPYIQQLRATSNDKEKTNTNVLAPTWNNLLRWSNSPGRYDMIGVDVSKDADATVIARAVKKAKIFELLGFNK